MQKIQVGDEVLIEQCWQDKYGQYYDEYATVAGISSDGTLKFRIGHWKTRKQRDQKIQAHLNRQEIYCGDVVKQ